MASGLCSAVPEVVGSFVFFPFLLVDDLRLLGCEPGVSFPLDFFFEEEASGVDWSGSVFDSSLHHWLELRLHIGHSRVAHPGLDITAAWFDLRFRDEVDARGGAS